jgi:formiminotetrahydrofolate cyclodeaminase
LLNVKINAKALDDKSIRNDLLDQAKKLQIAAREVMDLYTEKIEQDRL